MKDKLLFEDLTQYAASPWHQDMQTRQLKGTNVKISDLIWNRSGHPNDESSKAGNSMPAPMNTYQYDMGDLFLKLDNLEIKLKQIAENPVVHDSADNRKVLKHIIGKFGKIKEAIIGMGEDFDKLLD